MDKFILRNQFIQWFEAKTGESIPNDSFLDACLTEAARLTLSSKVNDVAFPDFFRSDELMSMVLFFWEWHVAILLRDKPLLDVEQFAGADVPKDPERRNQYLTLMARLVSLCK